MRGKIYPQSSKRSRNLNCTQTLRQPHTASIQIVAFSVDMHTLKISGVPKSVCECERKVDLVFREIISDGVQENI